MPIQSDSATTIQRATPTVLTVQIAGGTTSAPFSLPHQACAAMISAAGGTPTLKLQRLNVAGDGYVESGIMATLGPTETGWDASTMFEVFPFCAVDNMFRLLLDSSDTITVKFYCYPSR